MGLTVGPRLKTWGMDAPRGELIPLSVFATFRVVGVVDGKQQSGPRMCLCVPCVVRLVESFAV